MLEQTQKKMPAEQAMPLLQMFSQWENTTTIILHGGSVFEFKGVFPPGEMAHGFYNLKAGTGFEGHLNLAKVAAISFQSKDHRGQESHAFVFENKDGECVFKVFLGRDAAGVLHAEQKTAYLDMKQQYQQG
ncbi:Intracellular heme transport protein HutX [Sinobacterium norvegicum]|uniref:Intracellular heme transport protein HutX n=1 Tax=Sinobacterium norvegicum TaxID=1641715 RepID=A0ABM9ACF7_9GAMM|nr:heme utilization cystosolic carrier protein HutX [Sinobacterium norvegicum]CAH0990602.1 Intracellular heme transport protein HutX [Sinobacterium norvegicum]